MDLALPTAAFDPQQKSVDYSDQQVGTECQGITHPHHVACYALHGGNVDTGLLGKGCLPVERDPFFGPPLSGCTELHNQRSP
jgi:hypothetical protein